MPSVVEIGPVVMMKKLLNCRPCFSVFCYYLPLEKDVTLHEETKKFPLPKNVLCQVCIDLIQRLFWYISGYWASGSSMYFHNRRNPCRNLKLRRISLKLNVFYVFFNDEIHFLQIGKDSYTKPVTNVVVAGYLFWEKLATSSQLLVTRKS